MENDESWIDRIEKLESDVKDLKGALLGTLDGKPGLRALVAEHMQITQRNNEQLEALRLDRAKVMGIIVATGVIVGFGLKLLHL